MAQLTSGLLCGAGVYQLPWDMGETSPRQDGGSRGAGFAGGGAAPLGGGPQATLPWCTPPLLDQSLWPEVKGDLSTERDAQRQRRAMVPEARYHSAADIPATPHEPPERPGEHGPQARRVGLACERER